ncbi:MAG: rod shape-determining protein MreC [Treponema sp.]|nr:rod shape-determining protein MreC [Treponema sp.]
MKSVKKASGRFTISELVLIILVLFSGIMLSFSSGGFVISFQRVGFSVLSSIQNGITAVTGSVSDFFGAVAELSRLREENELLTEKLKNYEAMQRSNTEIRKENERLREQLSFSTQLVQKNYPAQIIGRNFDSMYTALTVNKGSTSGIRKGMPVLAIQNGTVGLVGRVASVGLTTSLILPVYDTQCMVSARIQNTRDVGLVSGMGSQDNPLLLRYIKERANSQLHYGDIVVTSGESENYISDIPIGVISKITPIEYESALSIELTPVIDFSRLETVIITDMTELNPSIIETGSREAKK